MIQLLINRPLPAPSSFPCPSARPLLAASAPTHPLTQVGSKRRGAGGCGTRVWSIHRLACTRVGGRREAQLIAGDGVRNKANLTLDKPQVGGTGWGRMWSPVTGPTALRTTLRGISRSSAHVGVTTDYRLRVCGLTEDTLGHSKASGHKSAQRYGQLPGT